MLLLFLINSSMASMGCADDPVEHMQVARRRGFQPEMGRVVVEATGRGLASRSMVMHVLIELRTCQYGAR